MKSSLPYFHLFYVLQLTYFPFPYHCLTSITNWDLVGLNYQHEVMSSPLSSLSILTYCYLSFNVKGILPSLNCSWYLHKYACMHACSNPDLPIAIIIGFFPEYSSGWSHRLFACKSRFWSGSSRTYRAIESFFHWWPFPPQRHCSSHDQRNTGFYWHEY